MLKITIKCRLYKIKKDLKESSDYSVAYAQAEELLESIINDNESNKHLTYTTKYRSMDEIKQKNLAYNFSNIEAFLKYVINSYPETAQGLRPGTADSDINAFGSTLDRLRVIKDEFYRIQELLSCKDSND